MELINIDVVCPIYKGYDYLTPLLKSIKMQDGVKINNIIFPLTIGDYEELDDIRKFIKDNNIISFEVLEKDFSHSLIREKAIREYCHSHIVVMISQDVKIENNDAFYNLCYSIANGETVYNYGKQIVKQKTIEKYIREINYRSTSYQISKEDIEKEQIKAFFASDAFAAYDRDIFLKVDGYHGYDVMMNEDMLYSKIILEAGYKKGYCANAVVEHSHKLTLKQLYKRYYDTGIFFARVHEFDNYQITDSGFSLALKVLKRALKDFNIKVLLVFIPNMLARYLGMRKGKKNG